MIQIDKKLISNLFEKALTNPRLRHSFDLRNPTDGGQRMLNALLPGTVVPVHRHPQSNENVLLLCGKLVEIIYDENGNDIIPEVTVGDDSAEDGAQNGAQGAEQ